MCLYCYLSVCFLRLDLSKIFVDMRSEVDKQLWQLWNETPALLHVFCNKNEVQHIIYSLSLCYIFTISYIHFELINDDFYIKWIWSISKFLLVHTATLVAWKKKVVIVFHEAKMKNSSTKFWLHHNTPRRPLIHSNICVNKEGSSL